MTRPAIALALGFGLLGPLGCDDDSGGGDTDGSTSMGVTTTVATTDPSSSSTTSTDPTTAATTEAQTSTSSGSSGDATTEASTSEGDTSSGGDSSSTGSAAAVASATIVPKSESESTGDVTFYEEGGQIRMEITVSNTRPEGLHGIHIHQTADCSADDGSSAGGHWNPAGAEHGPFESGHLGDLGNIEVDAKGNGTLSITTTMAQWSVGSGDDSDLAGRAIILHEREDDLSTSPDPGPRVGCGEIAAL